MGISPQEVTCLLHAWIRGDRTDLDRPIPPVSGELYLPAHLSTMRECPGRTQRSSVLVREADLRLVDAGRIDWQKRAFLQNRGRSPCSLHARASVGGCTGLYHTRRMSDVDET